jgi:hypothetical protein
MKCPRCQNENPSRMTFCSIAIENVRLFTGLQERNRRSLLRPSTETPSLSSAVDKELNDAWLFVRCRCRSGRGDVLAC